MENLSSISGFLPVFGLGMLGGLAIEILKWYKLRESSEFPHYVNNISYWLITMVMITLGGVIACLYGTVNRDPISVVQLGASTPALLGVFMSKTSSKESDDQERAFGDDPKVGIKRIIAFLSFRG